jgi:hypothetical protein
MIVEHESSTDPEFAAAVLPPSSDPVLTLTQEQVGLMLNCLTAIRYILSIGGCAVVGLLSIGVTAALIAIWLTLVH